MKPSHELKYAAAYAATVAGMLFLMLLGTLVAMYVAGPKDLPLIVVVIAFMVLITIFALLAVYFYDKAGTVAHYERLANRYMELAANPGTTQAQNKAA